MSQSLVHMLFSAVQKTPDAEAIIDGNVRITYEQLWANSLSVAYFLHKQGLQQGERITTLIENSHEYVAIYYGVMIAGGVIVGLNTAAKTRDLVNWIKHSGAKWLFANVKHPELSSVIDYTSNDLKIVYMGESDKFDQDYTWQEIINTKNEYILPEIRNSKQIASIIYTSGTTGSPKGVTLSHFNLASNMRSILAYLKLTDKDKILNILPFYYTYGNSILHTHLAVGASVVLENSMMYPHRIVEKMVSEKVTGFSGVPSTFALLLGRTKLHNYDLSSVRYMTQAGGPMPPASIKRLIHEVPHIQFFVMYGQTEATARLTYLPPERLNNKMGSVGIPIPGVTIEVRDEQDNVVDAGTIGEICAQGDNLMLGYWNDPESTKQVIRDGWLHTGDLAYIDTDGFIYIVGRSSDMIKSGAYRICPNEIEEVISELNEVQEVAVVGVTDDILGQVVKAVIVLRPNEPLQSMDIRAYCKKSLADYKVPKIIEFVDVIPKTASGKIKRYQIK